MTQTKHLDRLAREYVEECFGGLPTEEDARRVAKLTREVLRREKERVEPIPDHLLYWGSRFTVPHKIWGP